MFPTGYRVRDWREEYRVLRAGAVPPELEPVPFLDAGDARRFLAGLCSYDDANLHVLRRIAAERFGALSAIGGQGRDLLARLADDLAASGWLLLRPKRPDLFLTVERTGGEPPGTEFPDAEPPHRLLVKVVDDETGAPVGGCRFAATLPDGAKRTITTRPDGIAEVSGVKPGSFAVEGLFGGITLATTLAAVEGGGGKKAGAKKDGPPKPRQAESSYAIAKVKEHRVKKGDTLGSIAQGFGLSPVQLAYFNFGVYEPEAIEAALRDEVGCLHRNKDGKYVFDDSDEPGIVYVPSPWSKQGLPVDVENEIRVRRVERVLPALKLWYQLDPHDENAKNDTLTLEAEDGSYVHELMPSECKEVHPGWVELAFPEPPVGKRFHLLHDPKDGEEPFYVFYGVSYGDLREAAIEQEERQREAEQESEAAAG